MLGKWDRYSLWQKLISREGQGHFSWRVRLCVHFFCLFEIPEHILV